MLARLDLLALVRPAEERRREEEVAVGVPTRDLVGLGVDDRAGGSGLNDRRGSLRALGLGLGNGAAIVCERSTISRGRLEAGPQDDRKLEGDCPEREGTRLTCFLDLGFGLAVEEGIMERVRFLELFCPAFACDII